MYEVELTSCQKETAEGRHLLTRIPCWFLYSPHVRYVSRARPIYDEIVRARIRNKGLQAEANSPDL